MSGRVLLDSNVIIDISKKLLNLDKLIDSKNSYFISTITKMEVLGFAFESSQEEDFVKSLIEKFDLLYIDDKVIQKVIDIRKHAKIKLPDAIIAATAIVNKCHLITNNIDDFKNINSKLVLKNPYQN